MRTNHNVQKPRNKSIESIHTISINIIQCYTLTCYIYIVPLTFSTEIPGLETQTADFFLWRIAHVLLTWCIKGIRYDALWHMHMLWHMAFSPNVVSVAPAVIGGGMEQQHGRLERRAKDSTSPRRNQHPWNPFCSEGLVTFCLDVEPPPLRSRDRCSTWAAPPKGPALEQHISHISFTQPKSKRLYNPWSPYSLPDHYFFHLIEQIWKSIKTLLTISLWMRPQGPFHFGVRSDICSWESSHTMMCRPEAKRSKLSPKPPVSFELFVFSWALTIADSTVVASSHLYRLQLGCTIFSHFPISPYRTKPFLNTAKYLLERSQHTKPW